MRQKVFVKAEKCLVCDLKAGDLYILELPDPEYFQRELNRALDGVGVLLRTNVASRDTRLAYRVHIVIIDREDPLPPRVNPYAPPGAKK